MKILSNLKIKDITGFIEFYESIGFKKLSDFKTNNEIVNATFEYNDNFFKIFKTNKIIKQSMSFHFNKDEKKDVKKLMSLFIKNGGKVTCDIEESCIIYH